MMDQYHVLVDRLGHKNVLLQERMDQHTTFRIGGPADCFVLPENEDQLVETVSFCRQEQLPFYLMGNGSNLLVGDGGFRGVIIQLQRNFNHVDCSKGLIRAQAGAMLSSIARLALHEGLTGFEFASGIPGTLGGAVIMNAGAYGGEMKNVIVSVRMLMPDGQIREFSGDEMAFGYRTSRAAQEQAIVLSAALQLQSGKRDEILSQMETLRSKRIEKQPLDLPSAGSTFKRPVGYFAGKLIMDAGLAGFSVGGAQVSPKHCGFVVNTGDATAADVRELMDQVQKKVWKEFQVMLEPEVKMLGEFL